MRSTETHTWPALRNDPLTAKSAARSRSASSRTTIGSLPPSSRTSRFRSRPARSMIDLPTAWLPTKAIISTSAATSAFPVSSAPCTSPRTPGGSAPAIAAWRRAPESGVTSEGFHTTVFPARSAGASSVSGIESGKFQGVIAATTPSGSYTTWVMRFPSRCSSGSSAGRRLAQTPEAMRNSLRLAEGGSAELPHLAGDEVGERLGVGEHPLPGLAQRGGPLRRRSAPPIGKRGARLRHLGRDLRRDRPPAARRGPRRWPDWWVEGPALRRSARPVARPRELRLPGMEDAGLPGEAAVCGAIGEWERIEAILACALAVIGRSRGQAAMAKARAAHPLRSGAPSLHTSRTYRPRRHFALTKGG